MKNKKSLYFLVPIVLIIWVILVIKLIEAFSGNRENYHPERNVISHVPFEEFEAFSFDLLPINRDPFLNISYKPEVRKKTTPRRDSIKWPNIDYLGLVGDKSGESIIFFIDIQGHQGLLRSGQELDGVKIINGDQNAVLISYAGERKTISK